MFKLVAFAGVVVTFVQVVPSVDSSTTKPDSLLELSVQDRSISLVEIVTEFIPLGAAGGCGSCAACVETGIEMA